MTRIKTLVIACLLLFFAASNSFAQPNINEIQRRFNAETINKPFSVPDDATLTNALKKATQRGTPTRTMGMVPPCVGLGCALGLGRNVGIGNIGYGGYFGGYPRPYYGGLYGTNFYNPYYYGW